MKVSLRIWILALLVAVGVPFAVLTAIGATRSTGTTNEVLGHALDVEEGIAPPDPHQAAVSGGVINAALDFTGALEM
jgi:hypothetical protein